MRWETALLTANEIKLAMWIRPNPATTTVATAQADHSCNRNRTGMVFDALGLAVGTAVKGKSDTVGDSLTGFEADLTSTQLDGFHDGPDSPPA